MQSHVASKGQLWALGAVKLAAEPRSWSSCLTSSPFTSGLVCQLIQDVHSAISHTLNSPSVLCFLIVGSLLFSSSLEWCLGMNRTLHGIRDVKGVDSHFQICVGFNCIVSPCPVFSRWLLVPVLSSRRSEVTHFLNPYRGLQL